ncbi:hypothetical protein SAY87_031939 [Trapa incisa]|uniref:Glycosyl transferase CAP10 domain-containing protein n=1 Tax=Trapa incisa TaxID=236973 RepID=A0AAN7QLE5_9MYRT|nr:hypothetical protein SAY87_031939 [Trapa incisa]
MATWRRPPTFIIRKRLAGATPFTSPSILFLFSALVMIAFITVLNNFRNMKWAVDVHWATIEKPRLEFPLNCSGGGGGNRTAATCPKIYYPATFDQPGHDQVFGRSPESGACPEYFRWTHEDLKPWRDSGIKRDMVERAKLTSHFRIVVIGGRVYVETYKKSTQTRDLFTVWGILQLLRRYPGRIPDLELVFDCDDRPVIRNEDYSPGRNGTNPPPLFRYSGDQWTMDIVFPDWAFWGWPEINIKPWEQLREELKKGNDRTKWSERVPFAYWKGNPYVAGTRMDLLSCNVSESYDWNARLFIQDWIKESRQGYKNSGLSDQCTHRSIKFAVEWGNTHQLEAEAMGRAAAAFIQEQVKMEYVYDYMFHLLKEYSKLLMFEPRVPQGAVEVCSESLSCSSSDNGH